MEEITVRNEKTILVQKTGVVEFDVFGNSVQVNGENLISTLQEIVDRMKPKTNHNGAFAARITLNLEFLGDMEGTDELCE